jgi:hypothetical protein
MRRLKDRRRSTSEIKLQTRGSLRSDEGLNYMSQARIPPCNVVSSIADWERLYQFAILELDPNKLPRRVSEAHRAIFDRAEEIMTTTTESESRDLRMRCVC